MKEENDDKITAVCVLCGEIRKAYRTSTGNLTAHFRDKHNERVKELLDHIDRRTKAIVKMNQPVLPRVIPLSIEKLRQLILDFIISENLSFDTVRKKTFKDLLEGVAGCVIKMPASSTFVSILTKRYDDIKNALIELLKMVKYVCTTSDVWSCRGQSYLGMTIHFYDETTLTRKSYVLAFRRLKGKQDYLNLGRNMHNVQQDYELDEQKIKKGITDGGSNFGKAHRKFGINESQSTVNEREHNDNNESEDEDDEDDFAENNEDIIIDITEPSNETDTDVIDFEPEHFPDVIPNVINFDQIINNNLDDD